MDMQQTDEHGVVYKDGDPVTWTQGGETYKGIYVRGDYDDTNYAWVMDKKWMMDHVRVEDIQRA